MVNFIVTLLGTGFPRTLIACRFRSECQEKLVEIIDRWVEEGRFTIQSEAIRTIVAL
jgi:hypothetical protein